MSGYDPRYTPPGGGQPGGGFPPPPPPVGPGGPPPGGGYTPPPPEQPGKGKALAALILGIAAIVFSYVPFIGIAAGIVGIFMALGSKKVGFTGGMLTAGMICSIIGTALGAILTVSCIACAACAAADPWWMDPWYW